MIHQARKMLGEMVDRNEHSFYSLSRFDHTGWTVDGCGQAAQVTSPFSYLGHSLTGLTWSILLFALFMSVALKASAAEGLLAAVRPQPAPTFRLQDLEGRNHQLLDYRGRVLIVNFWASWCVPCRRELPSMNRAWTALRPRGIAMLAINLGDDAEAVKEFLYDFPIDFPVLLDHRGRISQRWQVRGLPTTLVLNQRGEIVYRAVGEREWDDAVLLHQLQTLQPESRKLD
ncbi:MAG: TlpA disulfide reductase family protein [Candidatus Thiodiazotropha endolucinida]